MKREDIDTLHFVAKREECISSKSALELIEHINQLECKIGKLKRNNVSKNKRCECLIPVKRSDGLCDNCMSPIRDF